MAWGSERPHCALLLTERYGVISWDTKMILCAAIENNLCAQTPKTGDGTPSKLQN